MTLLCVENNNRLNTVIANNRKLLVTILIVILLIKNIIFLFIIIIKTFIGNAQVLVFSNIDDETIGFDKTQLFTKVMDGGLSNF